jgi:hypothetical protein
MWDGGCKQNGMDSPMLSTNTTTDRTRQRPRRSATALMDTAVNSTLIAIGSNLRIKRPCKGTARDIGSAQPLLERAALALVAGANGIELDAFTNPCEEPIISIPQSVDTDATLGI